MPALIIVSAPIN